MGSPARVLVIDDSPTILKVVSAILARHGFEPVVARDGLAGMEQVLRGPKCDLILLDFVMPRMNGYQFCRELRSNPAHRALPVVLMSAKGDKIRGQFVQQTGAVDAITKPFDARALVAVIEGALAKAAEGRARPVPDGKTMPEEETVSGSYQSPSMIPPQVRQRAAVEFAQQVATAVSPAVLTLPDEQRSEGQVMAAVARSMTPDVVSTLAATLKEFAHEGAREVMSGDLAAIPLAEILQLLQLQKQTGVLRISNSRTSVVISIRQGLVDLVQSRGAADEFRLGRYFVEKGLFTRERLDEIVAARQGTELLGEALVRAGTVTSDDLREALSKQSSELIYDILRWPFGRFVFTKEPFRAEAEQARLGLGVAALVLEGFRRVDEWRLMEGTIHFDQIPFVDPVAIATLDRNKLTRSEVMVLEAVDGSRTVNEVIKESAVSSFDAIKAIYQFLQSRVLRVKPERS